MRRKLLMAAQWLFAIVVVGVATVTVVRKWEEVRGQIASLDISWLRILAASLIVLATYALLIETWRRVLAAWDRPIAWIVAARIWFASSLAKYLPGSVWSIAALGVMARGQGISGIAATGSSLVVSVLNLASGVAIALLIGAKRVPHHVGVAVTTLAVIAGAVAAPALLPRLAAWLSRMTGKKIPYPNIPASSIWFSLAGTGVAWLAYGFAFYLFARGLVGDASVHGGVMQYVAVYAGAYILGFVTPVPAGLAVREAALVEGFTLFGLMGHGDALVVALTSRLWLTILEVAPSLVALAAHQFATHPHHASHSRSPDE